jgi:hypothetical protein
MARTYSAKEIAADARVTPESAHVDHVDWTARAGRTRGFTFGAVFAVRLVSALLDAGPPEAIIERAIAEGWLNFDGIDDRIPDDPGPRSSRTFAEFQAVAGPRASLLPAVYEVMGLPGPDPSVPIHRDEETMFQGFLAGWQAADDDLPAAGRPADRRGHPRREPGMERALRRADRRAGPGTDASGRDQPVPSRGEGHVRSVGPSGPQMFMWLSTRYLEQRATVAIVDGFERFLPSRNLAPDPESPAPPAIVFVDLSGFTRLTEERGDESAVQTATSLQREADAAATRHGGRLVKLLGDGAMLRFPEPIVGTKAALDLVETMSGQRGVLGARGDPRRTRDRARFGRLRPDGQPGFAHRRRGAGWRSACERCCGGCGARYPPRIRAPWRRSR